MDIQVIGNWFDSSCGKLEANTSIKNSNSHFYANITKKGDKL